MVETLAAARRARMAASVSSFWGNKSSRNMKKKQKAAYGRYFRTGGGMRRSFSRMFSMADTEDTIKEKMLFKMLFMMISIKKILFKSMLSKPATKQQYL